MHVILLLMYYLFYLLYFSEDWGKGGKDDQMGKSGGKGGSVREPVVKVVAEVELKVEEGQYLYAVEYILFIFFLI